MDYAPEIAKPLKIEKDTSLEKETTQQLAYGYKKAVVSSDLPAFTQFVKEGKTGYVSKAGDPDSLAQAMERAILDRERLSEVGQNGYNLVKQTLNWDDLAEKIVNECYKWD